MKNLIFTLLLIIGINTYGQNSKSKNEELETRLVKLEKKNDSLERSIYKIMIEDYKSVDLIDKVNNYYDNAWSKLIYLLSALGGIMVVALPIFLTRQQKNELKTNKLIFQEDVDKKILELEQRIISFNKKEVQNVREELKKVQKDIIDKQERDIERLYAMSYYLQGIIALSNNESDLMLGSFLISIDSLIKLKTPINLSECLDFVIVAIDKKNKDKQVINKEQLDEIRKMITTIREIFFGQFEEKLKILEEKIN